MEGTFFGFKLLKFLSSEFACRYFMSYISCLRRSVL